jgi:hypothetical protein
MHRVKQAAPNPVLDGRVGDAQLPQVIDVDVSVLAMSKVRDRSIDRPSAELLAHIAHKFAFGGHGPIVPARVSPVVR